MDTKKGMTPEDYFRSFVLANYHDFKENPICIRRGFNAAIAASHMADHNYNYHKKNNPAKISNFRKLGDYIKYLSEYTSGHFENIRSIANAYKHLYTWEHTMVSSTGAIELIQHKTNSVNEVTTSHNPNESHVVYTKRTGEQYNLTDSLKIVIEYWEKEINNDDPNIQIIH